MLLPSDFSVQHHNLQSAFLPVETCPTFFAQRQKLRAHFYTHSIIHATDMLVVMVMGYVKDIQYVRQHHSPDIAWV